MPQLSMPSPVGELTLTERDGAIVSVTWSRAPQQSETPLLTTARRQLEEYFAGTRHDFDLPLAPAGSAFQRAVWQAMQRIPYGRTAKYGELAAAIASAPRAVGGACGKNPIPIIIPCHRVLAAGHLGGYSGDGGLKTKQVLLRLEGALPQSAAQPSLFQAA